MRFGIELAERIRDELGCVGLLVDAKPQVESFYEQLGFVRVSLIEGAARIVPAPIPMYLPLGAVPRRPS